MATHELYVGGPASNNAGLAMYPRPTFAAASWAGLQAAIHKAPATYALSRVIDPVNDYALAKYVRDTAMANADVMNLQVIPDASLLYAVEVDVITPAAGLSLTFSLSDGTVLGAAVSMAAAGKFLLLPGIATNISGTASAAASLANALWVPQAVCLRATVTAVATAGKLGGVKFAVTPLLSQFDGGAY